MCPKCSKPWQPNGASSPQFETDDDRLAYLIRPPVHPLAEQPEAATDQVTGEVAKLLAVASQGEQARSELRDALGLKHTPHFGQAHLSPAIAMGLLEMILPDKSNGRSQRYRLTAKGKHWLASQVKKP